MLLVFNKLLVNMLAAGLLLSSPMQAKLIAQNSSTQKVVSWQKFTSEESGFSVQLPASPDHIQQKIDIPETNITINYDTYISEPSESMVYVISVWNYPAEIDMSKPEVNLQDGFGGMLSALPGSQVQKMQMIDEQGFKALEFLVKNDDIYFQGKLILVYHTLYQVFAVYKESAQAEQDFQQFITSFKLINPEKRKVEPTNNVLLKKNSRKMSV